MKSRTLMLVLSLLGVIFTWMLAVPIFEFPDEQAHFGTVSFVEEKGRIPQGSELDMTREMYETQKLLGVYRNPLGQNSYTYHPQFRVEYTDSLTGKFEPLIKSFNTPENRNQYVSSEAAKYPPLYYRFVGLFTTLVDGADIITRIFVTRMGGLIIATAIAYTAWLIGKEIFINKKNALLLPVITFLQPMFSFVTAGINSDNLHNLWFTVLIFICLKLIKEGIGVKYLAIAVAVSLIDIYTKPQGFIALPVLAAAVLLAAIRHRSWKALISLIVLGLAAVLGSLSQLKLYLGLFFLQSNGASFIEYFRFSLNKLMAQNVVWYWGVFKWLGVVLPPIYWQVANRIVLVSAIGMFVYLVKVFRKKKLIADPADIVFLFLASVIYAFVIFWYDWQYLKIEGFSLGIQARYFFPTITAHLALLIAGILSFGWNTRVIRYLRIGLFLLFLWLQIGGFFRLLSVYYDTNSIQILILQMSQYKPFFAKGNWWYLWGTIYLSSLSYLTLRVLKPSKKKK